jgi:hypothetical protein
MQITKRFHFSIVVVVVVVTVVAAVAAVVVVFVDDVVVVVVKAEARTQELKQNVTVSKQAKACCCYDFG